MKTARLFLNGAPAGIAVELARTPFQRMRGFMGRECGAGGILLEPCKGIHTFFMRFPIDAVYLDAADRVIRIVPDIPPWRVPRPVLSAKRVLELPAGTARDLKLKPGDILSFVE